MSDFKTVFGKLTSIFSREQSEAEASKTSKKETLFDGLKSQEPNDIYNNTLAINQSKVEAGEKGSVEYLANLTGVDISNVSDVVYDKNGMVIKYKENFSLSNDYEKGRVRTAGYQYTVRYSADGKFMVRKTEILVSDDNAPLGMPMCERFEYDPDGKLLYSKLEY